MDEWEKYELHHRARLAIKPGLTGMWQVSGRSEITDFEEVVKLDTKYISEDELYDRVLCMEQIMSTGGGWQDQVGGLAPGIKMVTSEMAIQQKITCTPCKISENTKKAYCVVATGETAQYANIILKKGVVK